MSTNKKQLVVEIVSDAGKMVKGYEEAINKIEREAKKANVLEAMQKNIDEMRQNLVAAKNDISNVDTTNGSGLSKLQNTVDDLGKKVVKMAGAIRTLEKTVDQTTGNSLITELNAEAEKLWKSLQSVQVKLKDILTVTHGFSFDADAKSIKNIDDLIAKFYQAKKAFEEFNGQKKKGSGYSDEYKQAADAVYYYAYALTSASAIKPEFFNDTIISDTDDMFDKVENIIRARRQNIESEVEKINFDQIFGAQTDVASFVLKNGKIRVPLELEKTKEAFAKELNTLITQVQDQAEILRVPIQFIGAGKGTSKNIAKELKNLESVIGAMPDGDEKAMANATFENIKKQYGKDIQVVLKSNISDVEADIKSGIEAIRKALQDSKLAIYPEITFLDEDRQKLEEDLKKASKVLNFDLSADKLGKTLKELTDDKLIKSWAKTFNTAIDEVCGKIKEASTLLNTELNTAKKTKTKTKPIVADDIINRQDILDLTALIQRMYKTIEGISKKEFTFKASGFDDLVKKGTNIISCLKIINQNLGLIHQMMQTLGSTNGLAENIAEDEKEIKESTKVVKKQLDTLTETAPIKKWGDYFVRTLKEISLAFDNLFGSNILKQFFDTGNLSEFTSIVERLSKLSLDGFSLKLDSTEIDKFTKQLQAINKSLKEIVKNASSSSAQLNSMGQAQITLSPDLFDKINHSLENMIGMLQRAFGVLTNDQLDAKFGDLKSKFDAIAKDDGSIDARKKEVKELVEEYQKYLNLGGNKSFEDLTTNKKSQEKLKKLLATQNTQSTTTQQQPVTSAQGLTLDEENKILQEINPALEQKNKLLKDGATIASSSIPQEIQLLTQVKNELFDIVAASEKIDLSGISITTNSNQKKYGSNAITQHNEEVSRLYGEITRSAQEYFRLKEKEAKGKLLPNEISLLNDLERKWKDATQGLNEYAVLAGGGDKTREKALRKQQEFQNANFLKYTQKVESELQKAYTKLSNAKDSGKYTENLRNQITNTLPIIEKLKQQLPIRVIDDATIQDIVHIKDTIENLNTELAKEEGRLIPESSIEKLKGKIHKAMQSTGMPLDLMGQFDALASKIEEAGHRINKVDFRKFADEFERLNAELKKSGAGASFLDIVANKVKYLSAQTIAQYVSLHDLIRYAQEGFQIIKQFDSALTEMNKVSEENIKTLKEYQKVTFDVADAIGGTALALQESTADWMRLGEAMEEAAKSAKATTVLMNVSEFESIDEATESLVSMSAAYSDLEKMDIVDIMNHLGNNFAISTDGLATALQSSASALVTAKNDMYEAAALATAANAVVQDPDKVGNGLRTIALRLTGTEQAKSELEELGEDVSDFTVTTVSKLDEKIKSLTQTQDGMSVSLLDMNGNYRSTYEILLDIAEVWDKIAEEDLATGQNRQNALLEMIAGKLSCLIYMETCFYRTYLIARKA